MLTLGLALVVSAPVAAVAQPSTRAVSAAPTVSARSLLADLPVRAPDHDHRYQRARFGYDDPPLDADHDGCSTRKEVLIRDHLGAIRVSSSCAVYSRWKSLYDGRVTTDPSSLQIDHLVPLAEAWHAGAWTWSHSRQVAFGNDVGYPWELQAVTSAVNQTKLDKDPAKWMPRKNRCTYVKAWIGVKYRWRLSVDPAEKAALTRFLGRCASVRMPRPPKPNVPALTGSRAAVASKSTVPMSSPASPTAEATPPIALPTETTPPAAPPTATLQPVPVPTSATTTPPAPVTTTPPAPMPTAAPAVYYSNCAAARAAGVAPLRRGDPGYRSALDRDSDGIACEG